MQMALLPNYDIVVVERKGGVRYFSHATQELRTLAHFNVFSGIEDGLLGVAADPGFAVNHWLYFYYGVGGPRSVSHLVRYELKDGMLVESSKKVLLEIPTQREYCCHSAGHLVFDRSGLLYLSIGDNTNAEEIEGHNPTDERPGRHLSDGQASTANSNDYRGKILRIRPEADGTYSIPDGNLFPKDGSEGKPEIYVMGVRNPFRISVDPKTNFLYWGDVGPDTQVPAEEGFLSYDEINQARGPGFFGYPYFLGANEAFPKYDFETKQEGPAQDPEHPVNESPNNTGIRKLPPARPAFIWYGKGPSKRWPDLGKGGASAMAGPVYYSDLYPDAPYKLPAYYNGKLFIYDWVRKWIVAVTMDNNGNYAGMEHFLPQLKVVAPMDMLIAPDGALYVLAYGTNWFARNTDSGIIRVTYTEGNRTPVAIAAASTEVGAAPLTVTFSAEGSRDFDPGDTLTYEWQLGTTRLHGKQIRYTFRQPGTYQALLTVRDPHGSTASTTRQIRVGNSPPEVTIATTANQSFYWDDSELPYTITINDREDQRIDPARVTASFNYLDFGKDLASVLSGGDNTSIAYITTEKYYQTLDCSACHSKTEKSIGPSLMAISERYRAVKENSRILANKIIKGGSGSWGSYPMPPHPDLSASQAEELAAYILSLGRKPENIPLAGRFPLNRHTDKGTEGAYVLVASYTDGGANGISPITSSRYLALRNPTIKLETYDEGNVGVVIATANTGYHSYIANITAGKYTRFNHLDLTHIRAIRFLAQAHGQGGTIEARSGAKDGPLLGTVTLPPGNVPDLKTGWQEFRLELQPANGFHDLYLVYSNPAATGSLFHLDWMRFER